MVERRARPSMKNSGWAKDRISGFTTGIDKPQDHRPHQAAERGHCEGRAEGPCRLAAACAIG